MERNEIEGKIKIERERETSNNNKWDESTRQTIEYIFLSHLVRLVFLIQTI